MLVLFSGNNIATHTLPIIGAFPQLEYCSIKSLKQIPRNSSMQQRQRMIVVITDVLILNVLM
jgi:hypothetical protein